MNTDSQGVERLSYNKNIHDILAPLYERRHTEIFNPTEQCRIRELLQSLLGEIPGHGAPRVLDFGAGTGNLTRQLMELGASVVAADVSEGILRELRALSGRQSRLETMILNGRDLAQFDSGTFDMTATYSVLHHVPDYLAIVDEFSRVLKPGGIVYIDHEVCPAYWDDDPAYLEYSAELALQGRALDTGVLCRMSRILSRKGWFRYLVANLRGRRHPITDEGDIHVHRDDHIEWQAVRNILERRCEIIREEDYLVCREPQVPPPVWERWHKRCVDMRLIVARKK